jgi:hypothetical protein
VTRGTHRMLTVLLMRVEVIKDDVKLAIREGGHKAVHKAEELDPASPF